MPYPFSVFNGITVMFPAAVVGRDDDVAVPHADVVDVAVHTGAMFGS